MGRRRGLNAASTRSVHWASGSFVDTNCRIFPAFSSSSSVSESSFSLPQIQVGGGNVLTRVCLSVC